MVISNKVSSCQLFCFHVLVIRQISFTYFMCASLKKIDLVKLIRHHNMIITLVMFIVTGLIFLKTIDATQF